MHTIRQASALTGVSESTLRAWDRRYGLGATTRSDGGYRLYDDAALVTVRRVKELVDAGWSASAAVAEVCGPGSPDHPAPFPVTSDAGALIEAATRLDSHTVNALIDQRFREAAFETVIDTWLLPTLREVGDAWEQGRLDVAGEHLIAEVVRRRLGVSLELTQAWATGGGVVLGLPPGARHDLGLMAFAVALQRRGLQAIYLGANVPLESWIKAVASPSVVGAVSVVTRSEDVPITASLLETLREHGPEALVIGLGGAAQDLLQEHAMPLGHEIGAAATRLSEALVRAR